MSGPLQRQTLRPYGVVRDVPASVADPARWNAAINMRMRDGVAARQLGYLNRPEAPLFLPERLHYRFFESADQFLYAGNDGIGLMEGSQYDITPADYPTPGVLAVGKHQWTDLNGIPVWTHPQQVPGFHNGDTSQAVQDLPGWPATWRCAVIRGFKFYLIALDVAEGATRYENQVRWSASANVGNLPDEWIPSATNDAGDMFFAGTPGAVVDAVPLKDALVVYKNASTFFMEFIGDIFVFKQRKLFTTTGILTPNCATEWRGRHFVASEGDLLVHDGNSATSVCDRVLRREIFDDISSAFVDRCFVYHDTATFEMSFVYASRSSEGWCDKRVVWNYRDDAWWQETLQPEPVSHAALGNYAVSGLAGIWDEDFEAWDLDSSQWDAGAQTGVTDKTLVGHPVSIELGQPLRGFSRNGEAVNSVLSWDTKDLGSLFHDDELPRQLVLIDRVWIDAIGASGIELQIRFGFQETDGSSVELGEQRTFVIGQDAYLDVHEEGRLVSVEITCSTVSDWEFHGMTLDYFLTGRF